MGDEWVNPAADEKKEGSSNESSMLAQKNALLEKQLALAQLQSQQNARTKTGDGASKQIAEGMKKGMKDGIAAGGSAVRNVGNASWNMIGRPNEKGTINLFVLIAVCLSLSQASLGYRFRAHIFFLILGVLGWVMVFKEGPGFSRESLAGLGKSLGIAVIAWYWPIIFYKIPLSFVGPTWKLIMISVFNPYLVYFILINPMTPLMHKLEKVYFFAITIILLAIAIQGLNQGTFQLSPIPGVDTKAGFVLFGEMVWDSAKVVLEWIEKGYEDIETWVLYRVDYATGGALYGGQTDPDAETRLGVYFKEMKTTHSEIYDDEPLTVYAQIQASTLDDPIQMRLSCLGDMDVDSIDPKKNIPSDSVIPDSVEVDRKDRHDIDCMFNAGKLPAGSHTVSIVTEFDFKTNAKQKAYFVDKERAQALARNDVDILDQYGIKDKNPTAIYTDGPIMVGMGFTNQPVKLDSSSNQPATLGISVQSRWEGKITHINSLTLSMPRTMSIVDNDCSGVPVSGSVDGESMVYSLTSPGDITKFEPYRSFRCPIEFSDVDGILGSVPVATRFFQVEVDYGYKLTKDLSVSIRNSTLYDSSTGHLLPQATPVSTVDSTVDSTPASTPEPTPAYIDNDADPAAQQLPTGEDDE